MFVDDEEDEDDVSSSGKVPVKEPTPKKDLTPKGTVFSRIEESRKALEDELGTDLFIKAYKHMQVHFLSKKLTEISKSFMFEEDKEDKEEAEGNSAAESTSPPSPTIYKYSFKLKFHTKIFGTFKQTLVLDFGVRPLLSKVVKQTIFTQQNSH